jgi:hypothetical protein
MPQFDELLEIAAEATYNERVVTPYKRDANGFQPKPWTVASQHVRDLLKEDVRPAVKALEPYLQAVDTR